MVSGTAASSFPYSISPGGAFVLESDVSGATQVSGWARISPQPAQSTPAAGASFRVVSGVVVITEAGVASAVPTTRARLYVDNSGGHATGVAIASPTGATTVELQAFDMDGKTAEGSASFSLAARGHRANLASDLIAELPENFAGVMEVSSATPFVALTLRETVNSRGGLFFSTFPNADLTRPAPSPVIFPHIADGGYRTEFILLGPLSAADTTLRLHGEGGSPLAVAKLP